MKNLILLLALSFTFSISAQSKYITKTGNLTFEASMPAFEEVKANNKTVTAILNTDNGQFAALAFIKAFRFKNALMEEHFNENYAESDDFPKSKFKGEISNLDLNNLSETNSEYSYSGTLEFHGKTKKLENQKITIQKKDDQIILSGEFTVNVDDFAIEIPSVVKNKLSKDVSVTFQFQLNKK